MTLSGIEIRYLINEISSRTTDYYVSNIYGISKNSILFKFHHPNNPDVLLMFSTFGFWISSVKIEQMEQNKLLKRFRNDLIRLRLTKIEQIDAERIVFLTFEGFGNEFVLVGEFFGDGNIILCNKDMKILALQHSIDVRHRQLKVGSQYSSPPQNTKNIFKLTESDVEEILTSETQVARWIGRNFGLPTKYAEEICRLSDIDPKSSSNSLTKEHVTRIFNSVNEIVEKVIAGIHEPVIVRTEKGSDVYPIKLGEDNGTFFPVQSFIEGLDTLFTENLVDDGKSIQSKSLEKKFFDLQTQLQEQENAILLVKQKSDEISLVAKSLFDLISQGVSSISDDNVTKMFEKNNSKIISEKGITFLKINDKKIKINLNSSIPATASLLFDEAKKQSGAIPSIEQLKKKTEKNLEKLENQVEISKESITITEIRKKNWYERYRWFYTSDGMLAIGGRDVSSNSAIIRKHLEKNDIVFHADIHGSPFFILKNAIEMPNSSLNEIAHATVCFSRAWREAMYGLSAYWVKPDQLKRSAPSGEYLPKGSFVIEGKRNSVNIVTLKLAVGIVKQDKDYLLSCGPPEPIKKNSIFYVIIEPTGSEMVDSAKKIKNEFTKLNNDVVKSLTIDDFVRIIPAGKCHITESGKGDIPFDE